MWSPCGPGASSQGAGAITGSLGQVPALSGLAPRQSSSSPPYLRPQQSEPSAKPTMSSASRGRRTGCFCRGTRRAAGGNKHVGRLAKSADNAGHPLTFDEHLRGVRDLPRRHERWHLPERDLDGILALDVVHLDGELI